MISIPILRGETEAKLEHSHVHEEVKRISGLLGRDFSVFLKERDGHLYFEGPPGALRPENWVLIPRYGTEGTVPDSPAAFALFFLTVTSLPFAKHHIQWADFCWECFDDKVGAIIEAFRGSGKSIFMRCLLAYLTGLYPEKSCLILRSADGPAKEAASKIANIISNNDAWKLWFPHVMPKSSPGQAGGEWSAQAGYSVIDLSRTQEEWAAVEASRTSPTLTKFGLGSKGVLGSRITLAMLADDIHDDENAESVTQLDRVITRFQSIVEYSRTPNSRLVIIGTPWHSNDMLQQLPRTGEYRKFKTPITINGEYPGGTPTWPEFWNAEAIDKKYNMDVKAGKIEFKRNFLLDLEADIAVQFEWFQFPKSKIEDHWPIRIGVDFAELEPESNTYKPSYFCAAVTAQEPVSQSWIIIDGYIDHITQAQGENVLIDLFNKYPGRVEVMCIEALGGGAVFTNMMVRMHKDIPIISEKGGGVKKEVRWERMLAPYFGSKKILVSDKEHPFLDKVRQALKQYPRIGTRGDWAADLLDALVWAHYHAFMETGDPLRRRKLKKDKKPNPFYAFAEMK